MEGRTKAENFGIQQAEAARMMEEMQRRLFTAGAKIASTGEVIIDVDPHANVADALFKASVQARPDVE